MSVVHISYSDGRALHVGDEVSGDGFAGRVIGAAVPSIAHNGPAECYAVQQEDGSVIHITPMDVTHVTPVDGKE